MVFAFHMQVFAPLPGITFSILRQGYLGVTFFFVLSGFVLTWSASERVAQSTFYWRRFARIYPAHLVALLIAIPIFYGFAFTLTDHVPPDWVKPFDPWIISLSLPVVQAWWSDLQIAFSGNPAAWTLTCEAFFYLLHPFVMRVLWRVRVRGALWMAACVVTVVFAYRIAQVADPSGWTSVVPLPVAHLPEFLLGMALAWAMRQGWLPRVPVTLGIGAIGVAVGLIVLGNHPQSLYPGASEVARFGPQLVTVAFALVIVAVAANTVVGRQNAFAHRSQVVLGEWSFAFYLVHASVMYAALSIWDYQAMSWTNLVWYPPIFLVALGTAAAVHYGVERPLETRIRRWADQRAKRRRVD